MIILSLPISRDGDIRMKGHLLEASARKIAMKARSTLSGETIALANAIDSGIWIQAMLIEMYLGVVPSLHINKSDPLPPNVPFSIHRDNTMSGSSLSETAAAGERQVPAGSSFSEMAAGGERQVPSQDNYHCRDFDFRSEQFSQNFGLRGSRLDHLSDYHPVHFSSDQLIFFVDPNQGYPTSFSRLGSVGSVDSKEDIRFVSKSPVQDSDKTKGRTTSFIVLMQEELVMVTRDEHSKWFGFSHRELAADHDRIFKSDFDGGDFFRLISLTDSANAYSAVLSIQPKSLCKLSKINLCYIRDIISNGVLSFVDAPTNLSDTLTKIHGNLKIFNSFCKNNYFHISFLGRAGSKILQRLKEHSADLN